MCSDSESIWLEAIVAYMEVESLYFLRGAEESHENLPGLSVS
jgi:hypothetical protein